MKGSIKQRFQSRLAERQSQALYRQRPLVSSPQAVTMTINGQAYINFCSNDYLGLASHPKIKDVVCKDQAAGWGSGAAHLVTGHHHYHHQLEQALASWLGTERALLFSTGYMANLAVQQTLLQSGDVIIADKLNHASLIDGALASSADFKRYPHLDYAALSRRLAGTEQQSLIVTDSVFSMDGDLADIAHLTQLADQHQAWLLVDDAHAMGVLGAQGRGSFSHFGVTPAADHILMGTFGKAFGTSGAFVAGSEVLIESLIQFARPFIYTTAMSPLNALATLTALELVQEGDQLRARLNANITQLRQGLNELRLPMLESASAIQPVLCRDAAQAVSWSEQLKTAGFWVAAIRPPTVAQARLRITLSASHQPDQIAGLIEGFAQLTKQ
ncbi:8-amino-7-oxononanoate synthase [Thiomicrospira sp. ALE5]|uniref:8-amino-7-oxononanoate synthase n=1 Tax=Thiomicrospira sp. ALE5 TaxID=748650 RepID=UPI0008F1A8B3|nr:8-amino-7-oxononanoate synthase [Thiomicrospira sp. ALE5]SFR55841.1 8-amino-7-oxononanoate synthase [Thiomicrospira sp. ALE5]